MIDNQKNITLYAIRIPKRYAPLLQLEYEFKKAQRMDGMQLAFALIIELWKLITGNNIAPASPRPLSPAMRQALVTFISKTHEQISALENYRQSIYNRNRH